MADLLQMIAQKLNSKAQKAPQLKSGSTVNVYVKVKEGDKERTQLYKGVVIKTQGSGVNRSFTVRKISAGVGVERTFPFASPSVERVEVVSQGKVRRSRLFFLRDLKGKAARLQSSLLTGLKDEKAELAAPVETEASTPQA